MTNGNSSEFIQWRLEKNEKMKIMEGSARKTKVDHLQIKLELVEKDDNNCENSGANNNKEKKKKDEKKDNDEEKEEKEKNKSKDKNGKKEKNSKQVFFDPEKDKVITVENWKKFNVEKNKNCHCTLI